LVYRTVLVGIVRHRSIPFRAVPAAPQNRSMTTVTSLGYEDLPDLMARMSGDEKHAGASASTMDILWVLYDKVLDVAPDRVDDPARDRFLLSKGHGPSSYYAVLAAKGFLDPQALSSWGTVGSPLGFHPDHRLVPGVEIG